MSAGIVSAMAPPARPAVWPVPELHNGDRLPRVEFERRYAAMPTTCRAELIEGVVYMSSPVRIDRHAEPHALLQTLLGNYAFRTPGVRLADNGTVKLDVDNEPQPDIALWIDERCGGQFDDIEAARSDIGCYQHEDLAFFERLERRQAFLLSLVAVNRARIQAIPLELASQPTSADFGVGEHNRRTQFAIPDQLGDRSSFRFAIGNPVNRLLNVVGGRISARHLDEHRRIQECFGELADFIAERRRKHQILSIARQSVQNSLNVGQKTHIKHAIGFIKYQDFRLPEGNRLLAHMIEQPAWRRNQNFAAHPQRGDLRHDINAAEDDRALQARVLGIVTNVDINLISQLARRREDQCPHRMTRR